MTQPSHVRDLLIFMFPNVVNRRFTRSGSVCIPNVMLRSVLKAYKDRLHFCHVNAGSVPPKIDEIRGCFVNTELDIIVVSETWLKSYHSNKFVELPGFELIRNDRCAKRSGGVALYVRDNLTFKVLKLSERVSSEYLFIEVIFPDSKILVGAYYKAPGVKELDVFEDVLDELTVSYDDVLLLGDFNECLLSAYGQRGCCVNRTCSKCEFAGIIAKFGLTSVGTIASHYEVGKTPSLIDLCLTNKPEKVVFFNQISHGLSKHDMIFGSFSCNKKALDKPVRLCRNFAKVDSSRLYADACSIGWNELFYATDVSEKVGIFNRKVITLLEAHAPLKPFVSASPLTSVQPWFTSEIRRALLERDIAKSEYSRNLVSRDHYRRLRNRATGLVRKAKYDYLQPKLHVGLGSKALWRNLRDVGAVSSGDVKPEFTAEEFNARLTSPVSFDGVTPSVVPLEPDVDRCFSFSNVNSCDVARVVNSIKSKSVGLDNVPLTFVRMILPFVLPSLTHIINYSITSSAVARSWKLSKVLPVHKKTRQRGLDDFRPICILPGLSKVLEILAKEQVCAYLRGNGFLDRYQSGFRERHSTSTALLHVSDEIRKSFDKKRLVLMVLLDFSKAFDSLNHSRLLGKLSAKFKFSSSAVKFVSDYLSDRFQCVCIRSHCSELLLNKTGIPQGSVLGPLLFSLYINDLPSCLKAANHHMFADDVQLYMPFEKTSLNAAVFRMNQDLYAVNKWACENFLTLNAKKSQSIVFSESGGVMLDSERLPFVLLGGKVVPYADSVLNLGLMMDKAMSFSEQVGVVCSRVFSRLRSLWPLSHIFPQKTRLTLVKSLVIPAFTYSECVYTSNLSAIDVRSLERAFSACVRFVYKLRRFDSTRDYANGILGAPIMTYLRQRRCSALHGIVKTRMPSYLFDKLCRGNSVRSGVFLIPRHSSTQYNRSFFVRTVSDYNAIPTSVRELNSPASFSRACLARFLAS